MTSKELSEHVAALEAQIQALTKVLESKLVATSKRAPAVKAIRPPVDLTGAPTASKIDVLCADMIRDKDTWKGKGVHPILWSIGFRAVYQHSSASEKQVAAAQKIVCENRVKYARFFE
jgi:hypothetical protein